MSSGLPEFLNYEVKIADQVAHVALVYHARSRARERGLMPADPHWELFELMNYLRTDNSVRIVVLSGERDGTFLTVEPIVGDGGDTTAHFKQGSERLWKASTAIVRMHEAMAELDRPIIAKVNGDVIGLGASIMYAADLIVAREDARIVDNHLGMGEVEPFLSPHGVLPGDGGTALLPLFMSPARAKEFLMLAREDTAADLARMGVINYAVPAAELDALVDSLVERLLRRPAYALAWTKRVANKHVVDQLHRTLDVGIAYEMVNMYQLAAEGTDRTTLDQPIPAVS
jgi:enoyl-CoA hydratase